MITVTVDDRALKIYLRRLKKADAATAAAEAGEILLNANRDRNQAQKNPDGTGWAKLSPLTQRRKKRPDRILFENGDLLRLVIAKQGNGVVVGTASDYAEHHQYGTAPYTIEPTRKAALHFAGITVRRVKHPGLPIREIVGVT